MKEVEPISQHLKKCCASVSIAVGENDPPEFKRQSTEFSEVISLQNSWKLGSTETALCPSKLLLL